MEINNKIENCLEWYDSKRTLYDQCGDRAKQLIITLLRQNSIAFHSVEYRVKEKESFRNKCLSPRYSDPVTQITDLCGLRIISYTNHDVDQISKIIEKEFTVDRENSINKITKMAPDRVGYLSVHYVVKFNRARLKLSEYSPFKDIRFEIQIRTLLQHAWAEIEHDRSYKFSGELPQEIKRRFYLLAGTLELVDNEFEKLSNDIDKYAHDVKRNASTGKLDMPLDSTSLLEYLRMKFPLIGNKTLAGLDKEIIEELRDFGLSTIKDLDSIISEDFSNSTLATSPKENYLGLLRNAMIVSDPKKYFEEAWNNHWRNDPRSEYMSSEYSVLTTLNPDVKKYSKCYFAF